MGEGLPLSAFINKTRVHSFDYSKDEWNKLKQDRSSLDIKMTCCENRGILKTSRLGTHFFAHYRKGDCHSPAESKEHLLAKYIIAKTVHECGWKTFTEFQGETKNNEAWIADVYAEKGNGKIAFEIQLSPQTEDEYWRRQNKYINSGVRCAWFSKYRKNNFCLSSEDHYRLPKFSIEFIPNENQFIVKRFGVELSSFIRGMLSGKLKMHGLEKKTVKAGLIVAETQCWRCKKKTNVILGITYIDKDSPHGFGEIGIDSEFLSFDSVHPKIYSKFLSGNIITRYKLGVVKERYSGAFGDAYFSNGCFYCDALIGNHFLGHLELELLDNKSIPQPEIICDLVYGEDLPETSKFWTFNGKSSAPGVGIHYNSHM